MAPTVVAGDASDRVTEKSTKSSGNVAAPNAMLKLAAFCPAANVTNPESGWVGARSTEVARFVHDPDAHRFRT